MREYWQDLKDNWRDDYWRADHPEFMYGLAFVFFLFMSLARMGLSITELLITRRLQTA